MYSSRGDPGQARAEREREREREREGGEAGKRRWMVGGQRQNSAQCTISFKGHLRSVRGPDTVRLEDRDVCQWEGQGLI